jgi:signal transduction histidine kinase
MTGMVFGAFHGLGHEDSPGHAVWSSVAVLLAFLTGISMIWRRRVPVTILLVNAGAALVLPLDPLGTLIALTWVIGTSPVRHRVWSTSLAALVTGVALARDAWREPPGVVFATTPPDGGERLVMTWWGYLVVGVVLLGVAIGVGVIRRLRATADSARASAQVRARSAAVLRGELDRQEERDVIAREMHDTVAHHLSLVSLHAAVLEVTTTDPAVPESARAVRESAHRALEEMRGLISSLRDSGSAGYTGHQPTLADLPRLISDARSAGVAIAEDVVLIGGDPPPALTRAVYRIVQEALTNALKHAPGAGVRLAVRATSGYGVEIVVANWTAPARALRQPGPGGALARHGAGAGVIGMRERARALGGELWAGQDGHVWVVRAQLPWRVG